MANSSMCASAGAAGEMNMMDAAAEAIDYAANALSRADDARRSSGTDARGQSRLEFPAGDAPSARRPQMPLREKLPEGYLPIRELRDMALLGRWTPLDDKMSPCRPARVLAAMQRRFDLGDHDAASWLKLHARACAGEPEAQRVFGRVCESGLYRATADLQRAFFWYYRAGLEGDVQALKGAERLMRSTRISSATMAEPMLVYPGRWRISAHLSEQLSSASLFELAEDGTATGCLIGDGGEAVGTSSSIEILPVCACAPQAAASSKAAIRYHGGWAFDGIGNVLTIVFESSNSGSRRWRSDHWQIELLGCRAGYLFGRDRRMVAYTLQHLESEGHEP